MKCLDEETLEALVVNRLEPDAKTDALAHVRECSDCQKRIRQTVVLYRALDCVFAHETREHCPTGEELAQYDEGKLNLADRQRIDEHLTSCVRCASDLHELQTERQDIMTNEQNIFAATQAIRTIYQTASDEPSIQTWIQQSATKTCRFPHVIKLPRLMPMTEQAVRLAADTGSGFQKQTLDTQQSPFTIEIIQFGKEIRIALTAKPEMESCANSIIRLTLTEKDTIRLERTVLLEDGKGSCILQPEEASACIPEQYPLTVKTHIIEPRQMLQNIKDTATIELLIALLDHSGPQVRCSAIELLAQSGTPEAEDAITRLQNDPDKAVRTTAAQALTRLSNCQK